MNDRNEKANIPFILPVLGDRCPDSKISAPAHKWNSFSLSWLPDQFTIVMDRGGI